MRLAKGEITPEEFERLRNAIESQTTRASRPRSHHIIGSGDSRGLASLGLVEVERHTRGRLNVKLTTLGFLAINNP